MPHQIWYQCIEIEPPHENEMRETLRPLEIPFTVEPTPALVLAWFELPDFRTDRGPQFYKTTRLKKLKPYRDIYFRWVEQSFSGRAESAVTFAGIRVGRVWIHTGEPYAGYMLTEEEIKAARGQAGFQADQQNYRNIRVRGGGTDESDV